MKNQETFKDDIENILSSTPFCKVEEVKQDLFFRLTQFYEYKCNKLKGGDYQISKGEFSTKLSGNEIDLRIKSVVETKLKDDLKLYRNYAIDNSMSLSKDEIDLNLKKILSTQGYKIEKSNGNYTFSKNDFKELMSKVEFETLINHRALAVEKELNAEKRFMSKIDSSLLLTRGTTATEIKNVFLTRMREDHSYQYRITDTGNYYFIPDFNSFMENKRSYEVSSKDIDLKINRILNNQVSKEIDKPSDKLKRHSSLSSEMQK